MSLILLNNNSFSYTTQSEIPSVFDCNSGLLSNIYPTRYGDILCSRNGRIFFERKFADNVIITCRGNGDYNPQSFGNAIAYGLNSDYILRPCYWNMNNICFLEFPRQWFKYGNSLTTSLEGTWVENTLYYARLTLCFVVNGIEKTPLAPATSPVKTNPIPCTPTLQTFTKYVLNARNENGTIMYSFNQGYYDFGEGGYFYIFNSTHIVNWTNNEQWTIDVLDAETNESVADFNGYIVTGGIQFIPISAVL